MPADERRFTAGVRDLANATIEVAHRRGEEHLVNQILDLGGTLARPASVAVIGRRSFGKSSLLTALVGAEVTPSQEREATSTFIQIDDGGEEVAGAPRAFAHFRDPDRPVEEIPVGAIGDYALAGGRFAGEVGHLEVLADTPLLREGLRLIDTPGLGGLRDEHERVTLQFGHAYTDPRTLPLYTKPPQLRGAWESPADLAGVGQLLATRFGPLPAAISYYSGRRCMLGLGS